MCVPGPVADLKARVEVEFAAHFVGEGTVLEDLVAVETFVEFAAVGLVGEVDGVIKGVGSWALAGDGVVARGFSGRLMQRFLAEDGCPQSQEKQDSGVSC